MTVNPLAARAFDAMAEDYERGRPGWPADAVAALLERFGARTVLDLAAGTGKLTEILARHAEVIAVEPVEGMRNVLAARLPGVRVLDGTAEAIPLPDASVDAAFVAEAFHWFDHPRAVAELARVIRPGGGLVALWNSLEDGQPEWFGEVHATVMRHRSPDSEGLTRDTTPWREALEADERFEPPRDETAAHEHPTDRERMVAEIASFSSIGGLPDDLRAAALADVRGVLERNGVDQVGMRYRTLITTARRTGG